MFRKGVTQIIGQLCMKTNRGLENIKIFNILDIDSAVNRLTTQGAMIQDSMNTSAAGSYTLPYWSLKGQ